MTVYVLGAGASVHAGYPLCPELATDLHSWLAANPVANPSYPARIERLREVYGGLRDVERMLTELDTCPMDSPASCLSESERAYIRQAVRACIPEFFVSRQSPSASLYERFATDIVKAGDVVVTFNYDIALERELKRRNFWEIGDGYGFLGCDVELPPSAVILLKLHGSVNWLDLLFGGNGGFFLQEGPTALGSAPRVFGGAQLRFLGYDEATITTIVRTLGLGGGEPALILPTLQKRFFVQTSGGRERDLFWDALWSRAGATLAECERVVVIGYSMPLADERAKDLLLTKTNPKAAIEVYSGDDSARICQQFRDHGFQQCSSRGTGFFEDFLRV